MELALVYNKVPPREVLSKKLPNFPEHAARIHAAAKQIISCFPPDSIRIVEYPLDQSARRPAGLYLENLRMLENSFDLRFQIQAKVAIVMTWHVERGNLAAFSAQLVDQVKKAGAVFSGESPVAKTAAGIRTKRAQQRQDMRQLVAQHADAPPELQLLLAFNAYQGGESIQQHASFSKNAFVKLLLSSGIQAFGSQFDIQDVFEICYEKAYIGKASKPGYRNIYIMKQGAEQLRKLLTQP